ncbi:hypothetical protein H6P81_010929 [Aristolochia fimbriata]|uniref:Protein kinase domain-containing protein n=1 Tax=Aristolochia fimbriata TaxID=158543 RepID=A0AAV7EQS8_ARIFI|nr:hypothetical protein H6P81_010929 [Aristolochia fimbriata]
MDEALKISIKLLTYGFPGSCFHTEQEAHGGEIPEGPSDRQKLCDHGCHQPMPALMVLVFEAIEIQNPTWCSSGPFAIVIINRQVLCSFRRKIHIPWECILRWTEVAVSVFGTTRDLQNDSDVARCHFFSNAFSPGSLVIHSFQQFKSSMVNVRSIHGNIWVVIKHFIVEMKGESWGLIVGTSIGVIIGVLLAIFALFCTWLRKKQAQIGSSSSRRTSTIPIRTNGADSSTIMSDSTAGQESPKVSNVNVGALWLEGAKKKNIVSISGILKYSYKDLQKATYNFTTLIGQGAFGPVYNAQMSTGETVAVKVLATNSNQGEREFQTEVMLLGRLHHRNLVNLVGYCAEKGQHMLIYVYMSNGSLASHLYSETHDPLSWGLRVYIALDVARGLEYLHDGAIPPVIHRDIKSSNILLDQSMRARVADFGLSREVMVDSHASNIRGTSGYLDPEYVSSRSFSKKSDVYSFGILLFELIAGRSPQQGLLEYIELGALNTDGNVGWEEIADSRLGGRYNLQELNEIAALAYKCTNSVSKNRPSMRDIVQALSQISKSRHSGKSHTPSLSISIDEVSFDIDHLEAGVTVTEHHEGETKDSLMHQPEVLT